MIWKTIRRPGYIGKKRAEMQSLWDQQYGAGNWRIAYVWGNEVISRELAIQLYEDAYYEFFKVNREMLNFILSIASDVYDTAPTNIKAGLSYDQQETPSNHIHDVAIRRVVLRLGEKFRGDRLLHVRWVKSEGYAINPGAVPFHLPNMIVNPRIIGWWHLGTIEDFYQSNKILQVKKHVWLKIQQPV